jgi:hypothetical protein
MNSGGGGGGGGEAESMQLTLPPSRYLLSHGMYGCG